MGKAFWIGAIVLAAAFFWGVGYVVSPSSGDAEFQKMLDATRQVKSFRGVYSNAASTQHTEKLWEVDCTRGIVHKRSQSVQDANSPDVTEDQFLVGSDQMFTHTGDGSWQKSAFKYVQGSASWYCQNIVDGTTRELFPDVRAMLKSATFGEGDKKTVNGVRCRDWKFSMHSRYSGVRGTVCIGVDDHLPYEMVTDDGGHYSYSDYNHPSQIDVPEAVLQAVSSASGSN